LGAGEECVTASNDEEIKVGVDFGEKKIERSPAHVFPVAHHIAVSRPDPENRFEKVRQYSGVRNDQPNRCHCVYLDLQFLFSDS
jgi:hypothetical protein